MVDLGVLAGDTYAFPVAINAGGAVVGQSYGANGCGRGFVWTPAGAMPDIGFLPGGSAASVSGINDAGVVVGAADTPAGQHAFAWTLASGMVDLDAVSGAGTQSVAHLVNGTASSPARRRRPPTARATPPCGRR
jgi:probable HAF family extracellular repeat protein